MLGEVKTQFKNLFDKMKMGRSSYRKNVSIRVSQFDEEIKQLIPDIENMFNIFRIVYPVQLFMTCQWCIMVLQNKVKAARQ